MLRDLASAEISLEEGRPIVTQAGQCQKSSPAAEKGGCQWPLTTPGRQNRGSSVRSLATESSPLTVKVAVRGRETGKAIIGERRTSG